MSYVEWVTHLTAFFGGIMTGVALVCAILEIRKGKRHEKANGGRVVGSLGYSGIRVDVDIFPGTNIGRFVAEALASSGLERWEPSADLPNRPEGKANWGAEKAAQETIRRRDIGPTQDSRFTVERKEGEPAGPGSLLP